MVKKKEKSSPAALGKYFEAVGRRKTSIARVRLFAQKGESANIIVNKKPHTKYFPGVGLRKIAEEALARIKLENNYQVRALLKGGGLHSQAEALRHGIARALLKVDPNYRKPLKQMGFLKRDPRMKERRKFGLKKARKAPQWAKR